MSFNRTLWTSELTREKILFSNAEIKTILTFKSLFVFYLANAKPQKRSFSTRKVECSKNFLWNNKKTTAWLSLVSQKTVVAGRPTKFRCFSLDVILKKKNTFVFNSKNKNSNDNIRIIDNIARVAQCTVAESRSVAVFVGFDGSRVENRTDVQGDG